MGEASVTVQQLLAFETETWPFQSTQGSWMSVKYEEDASAVAPRVQVQLPGTVAITVLKAMAFTIKN